jgi:hypothetical protein
MISTVQQVTAQPAVHERVARMQHQRGDGRVAPGHASHPSMGSFVDRVRTFVHRALDVACGRYDL